MPKPEIDMLTDGYWKHLRAESMRKARLDGTIEGWPKVGRRESYTREHEGLTGALTSAVGRRLPVSSKEAPVLKSAGASPMSGIWCLAGCVIGFCVAAFGFVIL